MKQRLNCWASSYKAFPSFSQHLATRPNSEAWTPTPSAYAHWDAVLDFGSPLEEKETSTCPTPRTWAG